MGFTNYLPPEMQAAVKLAGTGLGIAKNIYFPGNKQAPSSPGPSPFYPGWVVNQLTHNIANPNQTAAINSRRGKMKAGPGQYHLPSDPYQKMVMDAIAKMQGGPDMAAPMTNASQYANNAAGAEYDPAISQLQQQLAQAPVDTKSHQKDIKGWFANALGSYNQGSKAYKHDLASELGGLDKASQGFIGALGGESNPAAYGLAKAGLNAHQGLAGEGLANTRFDKEMAGIIPLQGAQEHINEQNRGAQLASQLSNSLLSTKKAKGATYAKDYADMTQQNFQNQMSVNSQNLQKEQAGLSAALQGSQISANRASTEANVNRINQEIAASKAATAAATSGVKSNTLSNPSIKSGLETAIFKTISGPKGGLTMDPRTAWQTANSMINRYGFTGPKADALARSIFTQVLGASHSHHQFTRATMGAKGPHVRTHYTK